MKIFKLSSIPESEEFFSGWDSVQRFWKTFGWQGPHAISLTPIQEDDIQTYCMRVPSLDDEIDEEQDAEYESPEPGSYEEWLENWEVENAPLSSSDFNSTIFDVKPMASFLIREQVMRYVKGVSGWGVR